MLRLKQIDVVPSKETLVQELKDAVNRGRWAEAAASASLLAKYPKAPGSWVYFIEESDGDRVKIGWTGRSSPLERLSELSSASGRILYLVFAMPAIRDVEQKLHCRFAAQRVPSKTEWFYLTGDLEEAISSRGRTAMAREFNCPFILVPTSPEDAEDAGEGEGDARPHEAIQ